jgi:hypothetical protein
MRASDQQLFGGEQPLGYAQSPGTCSQGCGAVFPVVAAGFVGLLHHTYDYDFNYLLNHPSFGVC